MPEQEPGRPLEAEEISDLLEEDSAKARLSQAVDAAYLAEGYINGDGNRDNVAVANAIYPIVAAAHIEDPKERPSKAVTRSQLVSTVFPSLPKREDWSKQSDPELAEETYKAIRQKVMDLAKPDRLGQIQQMVGVRTPSLILCKTKVGDVGEDAVYVTSNMICLKEDFAGPLADLMRRTNRRMSLNMAMAGGRLPEHAKAFDKLYRQSNKRALNAGLADTALMLESAEDAADDGDSE